MGSQPRELFAFSARRSVLYVRKTKSGSERRLQRVSFSLVRFRSIYTLGDSKKNSPPRSLSQNHLSTPSRRANDLPNLRKHLVIVRSDREDLLRINETFTEEVGSERGGDVFPVEVGGDGEVDSSVASVRSDDAGAGAGWEPGGEEGKEEEGDVFDVADWPSLV